MNARQARKVVQRWVASKLLLGEGWGDAELSDADEARLEAAAERIGMQMLASSGVDAETRGSMREIVDDVLSES